MMQFPLFLCILVVFSSGLVSSTIDLTQFRQQALVEHNAKRQIHCASAMTLNSSINTIAQAYAEYLAANNLFSHSGHAGLGENLWAASSSVVITYVNGSSPTISWYNENMVYNYNSPGYSSSTGHFTQVVWKDSTQLGIGIALSSDQKEAVVVANYYPPGNSGGGYVNNVLRPCWNHMGGD